MRVLIIGGVAGGASTATRLRRLDENAEITILERGGIISYAPCGLPYFISGKIKEAESLILQTPETLRERYNIDVRIFNDVKSIDRGEKTVTVMDIKKGETYVESYDKLVIATGAEPVRPPIPGLGSKGVFTVRSIADAENIKKFIKTAKVKSAAIVGGGAVGMELAESLSHLGVKVTIVEISDHVIAAIDPDMAALVHSYLEEQGVSLILGNAAASIEETAQGLTLKLKEGKIQTDMLIMGVGVRPDSVLAKEAGLELGERGAIITDKHMRTSDPDIYALGDVAQTYHFITGKPVNLPLAGPATRQSRIAADNIAGVHVQYAGTQGTGIMKIFEMTVAYTGLTEEDAKREKIDYGKAILEQAPFAHYYADAREMNIKVVYNKTTGRLLGAQIVGYEGVDKRNDVFAMAIRLNAHASDLIATDFSYAPPYGMPKDPVNVAGQVIENMMQKRVSFFTPEEAAQIPKDGSAALISVEKKDEHTAAGEGFEYVPLEKLRARLRELDPGKDVYLRCKSGKQSYTAQCIFNQKGFNAKTLAGGVNMYETIRINHTRTKNKQNKIKGKS